MDEHACLLELMRRQLTAGGGDRWGEISCRRGRSCSKHNCGIIQEHGKYSCTSLQDQSKPRGSESTDCRLHIRVDVHPEEGGSLHRGACRADCRYDQNMGCNLSLHPQALSLHPQALSLHPQALSLHPHALSLHP